jgi:hypothetical protein
MIDEHTIKLVEARATTLHHHLRGMPPELQGAVISHLLATWIAGHQAEPGAEEKLAMFRDELLNQHIDLVRTLIPLEEARIATLRRKMDA